MSQRTKYGHDRRRNVKNAPIFLTPQVVRGILGIGHPKLVVTLEIVDIPLADACPPSKIYPAQKATSKELPSTSKLKPMREPAKKPAEDRSQPEAEAGPEPVIPAPVSANVKNTAAYRVKHGRLSANLDYFGHSPSQNRDHNPAPSMKRDVNPKITSAATTHREPERPIDPSRKKKIIARASDIPSAMEELAAKWKRH